LEGGQFCPQPAFSRPSGGAGLNILWLAESADAENKDFNFQPQASQALDHHERLPQIYEYEFIFISASR
jgi:hypothetical protein